MTRFIRRAVPALLCLLLLAGAATTEAANPAAEQLLLSHIPPSIAASCVSVEPTDPARQAQVDCKPGGAVSDVVYILFYDNASMDAAYNANLVSSGTITGQDCSQGPGQGAYTVDGVETGLIFCSETDGKAFIEWTDNRFGILSVGVSTSNDYAALFDWWITEPGPVAGSGVPQPTAEPTTPAETAAPATPGETAAPATPATTPEPGTASGPKVPSVPFSRLTRAIIHQILFSSGIDPTSGSPLGIADAFRTGTPKIFALVGWDIIDTGATLDLKLFQDDRLIAEQSVTPKYPHPTQPDIDLDGGFAVPFAPEGGFAAGSYTLEMDYHDLPEQVASFEVNDTGDGAPLPGNGSLGPSGTSSDLGPVPYADPASVLVVTRSSILRQHLGADTDAILAAAAAVGTLHDLSTDLGDNTHPIPPDASVQLVKNLLKAGTYKYLLIVGNDDAVPMAHIALPDSVNFSDEIATEGIDGSYVVSDDPYVNLDNDNKAVPDLAVARIPSSDDAQLLLTQLGENQPKPVGAFSMVNEVRRSFADGPLSVINAITPVTLYYSPPTITGQVPQTNISAARFIYILLHGDGSITNTWWGEIQKWTSLNAADPLAESTHEVDGYSDGMTVPSAGVPGAIVNVGACFGAYTLDSPRGDTHKTRDNSLALKFLASGSRTFIADTYISQSTNSDPGGTLEARTGFEVLLWEAVQGGASPIDAFFAAKSQVAAMVVQQYASGNADQALSGDANFLALHEMVYLGRP